MAIARDEDYTKVDSFGDDFNVEDRPAQNTSTVVQSGWDAAEKLTPTGDYPVDFKASETFQVIKFLDTSGPFASYKMHFLQNKVGKKSYVCLGANCPLCVVLKHRPEDKRSFSIVNFSVDPFQRQILTATPRLFKTLHTAEFSPQGPLTKNFWALSRSGVKQTTVYHFNAVKARDLQEDWGIDGNAAEAFLATVEPYPRSAIRENSFAELAEIAEELA